MTRLRLLAISLCVAMLSFGFAARSSHAQTRDATTGGPAVTRPATTLPTNTHSTCNAIWDLTLGVLLSYEPNGVFSQLVADLATNGTFVTTTTAGLDHIDLTPYDVLVVSIGSAWDRAYTPSEVAAIRAFQEGGGGLLVLADNANTPSGNINPVTVPLGTTCGLSLLSPLDLFVSNFTAHPIFTGIHQLFMRAAGGLGVALPSVAAALDPSGAPVISIVESPRTVVTGDVNILDNDYIGIADNRAFGVNVFNWLCQATPTPTRARTWGELKAIYR